MSDSHVKTNVALRQPLLLISEMRHCVVVAQTPPPRTAPSPRCLDPPAAAHCHPYRYTTGITTTRQDRAVFVVSGGMN